MNREKPTQMNDAVYEFYQPRGVVEVEFVFFHGLGFTEWRNLYETTWEVKDEKLCLLRDVIPKEFPRARVLAVSYDSSAKRTDCAGRMSLSNLGKNLVQNVILMARVGQQGCPVVLVGYCLGGLVMKQLCTEAAGQFDDRGDEERKEYLGQFLTNLKVVQFIDTPHQGTRLEKHLREEHGCHGAMLEHLTCLSSSTAELNEKFRNLKYYEKWKLFNWWYSYTTTTWDSIRIPKMQVVEEGSARNDSELVPVEADHSGRAVRKRGHWEDHMEEPRRCIREIIQKIAIAEINGSVFEFYRPRRCTHRNFEIEIVFFHGLCFSEYQKAYKQTWQVTDDSVYWIRELVLDDFPRARVLAVSYDSRAKIPKTENAKSFTELGELLVNNIIHAARVGQGGCPVVLVGYCLGAPMVKQICIEAQRQSVGAAYGERKYRLENFLLSVRGIMFLDTPYSGSSLAANLVELEECNGLVLEYLNDSSAALKQLDREFDSLVKTKAKEQPLGWSCENKLVQDSVSHLDIQETRNDCEGRGAGDFFSVCDNLSRSALSSQHDVLKDFVLRLKRAGVDGLHTTADRVHRGPIGDKYPNMNVTQGKKRGPAIIISMEKERPGSKTDWVRLQDMAKRKMFREFVIRNEERKEHHDVPGAVRSLLRENLFADDECVLCCVSAHGFFTDGIQLIKDDVDKSIQLVSDILRPIADHRLLVGKPKVFLINCCRVTDHDVASTSLEERNDLEGVEDCLLMYSTEFGREAKRAENGNEEGSIFFTELIECMSELDQTRDIESILELVKDRVAEESYNKMVEAKEKAKEAQKKKKKDAQKMRGAGSGEDADSEGADPVESVACQRPVLHSSLRRRLYWTT